MHFQALQKKAKETRRQEKKTEVKQKDGTVKVIQKYKRKRRFGRSINHRAPARFLLELKRKAEAVGGVYAEVDTSNAPQQKASQHISIMLVGLFLKSFSKLVCTIFLFLFQYKFANQLVHCLRLC